MADRVAALVSTHTAALSSLCCLSYTIRDAIFTFAQKLTQVSLIYHTEPTTKKWKTEKLKSKKRVCSEVSVNSPQGIRGVCAEAEKDGVCATRTVADDVQDSDWTES